MPTYLRRKLDGATYFFTVVTHCRRPWFRVPVYRRLLGGSFRAARQVMSFEIDAVVLLEDHFHVLMRPGTNVDYSDLWRLIKTTFTRHILKELGDGGTILRGRRPGERRVWQRRFFEHTIRDDDDWGHHVDYIHFNPVKHGYVSNPQDWPWSSVHRFVRSGWLSPDWPACKKLVFPAVVE